jgi:hypothetical protein
MEKLKNRIAALPTIMVGGEAYLSYQAVTNAVAAFLFPTLPPDRIDDAGYQRILETADTLCRELGYVDVVKLVPPAVRFSDMGLYWAATLLPAPEPEPVVIHAGPGRIEVMQDGLLLDAGHPAGTLLSQLGLNEVTRQHFKIPVTASDGLVDLLHRAVQSDWPNDYRGLWHDICGMCIAGGQDVSPIERRFAVIIRGLGRRRTWQMRALLKHDQAGVPYLLIALAEEEDKKHLFELGHVVMTPGAAALNVDFGPYLARHLSGDWGSLDAFDVRQNNHAVRDGLRILSAYDVPIAGGETERIWIITESDRSATSVLTPGEY